jgi:hypothetical protein
MIFFSKPKLFLRWCTLYLLISVGQEKKDFAFETTAFQSDESREWDLNPRPADYESAALPLSYLGF